MQETVKYLTNRKGKIMLNVVIMLLSRAIVRLPALSTVLYSIVLLISGKFQACLEYLHEIHGPTNIIGWWVYGATIICGLGLARWLDKRVSKDTNTERKLYNIRYFVAPQFRWAIQSYIGLMMAGYAAGVIVTYFTGGFGLVWEEYAHDIFSLKYLVHLLSFAASIAPLAFIHNWGEKYEC